MRNRWSTIYRWRRSRWLVVCACVVLTAGCQAEPTTVSGLVTLDGKPLAIRDGMRGTVVFQPASGEGNTLNGNIDAAGRFELAAGSKSEVTPAVYWVTVSAVEIIPPSADRPEPSGRRVTPGKYASAVDSGFRVEVKPGPNEVNLPLVSEAEAMPAGTSSATDEAAK